MASREYSYELDAFEIYHQEQDAPSAVHPALPALGHALSGAVGAALSNAVTYPLQLLITRLQVQNRARKQGGDDGAEAEYEDLLDAARKIYNNEGGIAAFYAGVGQEIGKSVADSFLFFLAYSVLRKARQKATGAKKLAVTDELGIGMVAGAFSKLFTTPIQQIVTRKQTAKHGADRQLTTREIAMQIKNEKGWLGFWTGYSATLILTTNPGLTFMLHDLFERTYRNSVGQEGSLATFVLAASAKAIASSITYPFALAKSRAQVSKRKPADPHAGGDLQKGDDLRATERKVEAKLERNTILGEVAKIARTEGVTGLYQGLSGEVAKGFLQHGLTMLLKDRAFTVIQALYFVLLKVLRKYPSPEELATIARERAEQVAEEARAQGAQVFRQGKLMVENVTKTVLGAQDRADMPAGDPYRRGRPKQ